MYKRSSGFGSSAVLGLRLTVQHSTLGFERFLSFLGAYLNDVYDFLRAKPQNLNIAVHDS